jgi:hypothetical protein
MVIDACYTPASFAKPEILQQKAEFFDKRIGTARTLHLLSIGVFIDWLNRPTGPMKICSQIQAARSVQEKTEMNRPSVFSKSPSRQIWY